mgnify:CR=1 FL=1
MKILIIAENKIVYAFNELWFNLDISYWLEKLSNAPF